jgi:hypothetical protein
VGGRTTLCTEGMTHNALPHPEPSISPPSSDPFTAPNSAICEMLSHCKQRTVRDASPSNNHKKHEGGKGKIFRLKMRKTADLWFYWENVAHNTSTQTNPIQTCFWLLYCFMYTFFPTVYFFSYRYRLKPDEIYNRQKQKNVIICFLFFGKQIATFALTVFHYWSFGNNDLPILTFSYLLLFTLIDYFYHHHTLYGTFCQGTNLTHAYT